MRVFLKTLCLMLCLCTVAAALSACFDKTVDFTVESDSTAVTGENTDVVGGGIGGGSLDSGSAKPFFDPSWTVKMGVTYYNSLPCVLRSAFDGDGRLVAEVYNHLDILEFENDVYIKYSYGDDGELLYINMYNYRLKEKLRIKFESVGDGRLEAVSVYEAYALTYDYEVTAEHHDNGMLKTWCIESEYGKEQIEYDGLGRRITVEDFYGTRSEYSYNGDSFEVLSADVNGEPLINVEYKNSLPTYITCGETVFEVGYDPNGNILKSVFNDEHWDPDGANTIMQAKYDSSDHPLKITATVRVQDKWMLRADISIIYDKSGRPTSATFTVYGEEGNISYDQSAEYKYNLNGTVSREKITATLYSQSGSEQTAYEIFYNIDGTYDRTEHYNDGGVIGSETVREETETEAPLDSMENEHDW